MLGYFGLKITIFYITSGMLLGIISGLIISRLKLEKEIESAFLRTDKASKITDPKFKNFFSRVSYGLNEGKEVVAYLWKWILIGVGIGALIHNLVPQEFVQKAVASVGIFSVPIATILGVPMYANCASILPVAVVIFQKGAPLGTAIAFLMAVSALSVPEAIILRKALKPKLLAIFFGIVSLGIMISGYILNFLAPFFI
jgi:hypothetical protein